MQVTVVLFGMFREKLAKSNGRLTLTLPDAATLGDLLAQLQIETHVISSVNGQLERDHNRLLKDGDVVQIMQAIGGGVTKLRFSVNLNMLFTEVEFLERFAKAAEYGFRAVEFLFPYEVGVDKIHQQLLEHKLYVALFNLPPGDIQQKEWGTLSNPYRRDYFCKSFLDALEAAQQLGCTRLNMMFGRQVDGVTLEEQYNCAIENLAWAAPIAAQVGVQLLIEPLNPYDFPNYALTHTEQAVEIIHRVSHPNVGLQYDLYHAQRTEGNLIEMITHHFPLIRHIQLADVPGRHEPGTGEINFPAVFTVLEQLGYIGFIGLEYKPSMSSEDSLKWLTLEERSFI